MNNETPAAIFVTPSMYDSAMKAAQEFAQYVAAHPEIEDDAAALAQLMDSLIRKHAN